MTESFNAFEPSNEVRKLRLIYVTFYWAALPLLILTLLAIVVVWPTWDLREVGPIEGPEATDGEVIAQVSALGLFAVLYVVVFFTSHRITAMRFSWLPFAAQIPSLLFLAILRLCWSIGSVTERLWSALYPSVLLAILCFGVITSLRLNAATTTPDHLRCGRA